MRQCTPYWLQSHSLVVKVSYSSLDTSKSPEPQALTLFTNIFTRRGCLLLLNLLRIFMHQENILLADLLLEIQIFIIDRLCNCSRKKLERGLLGREN